MPTMSDWSDHLTTLFPEVRLKRFLEMRGADGGPWRRLCALPALWVGLMYDGASLDAAWDLMKDWTPEEHELLRREVPRHALRAGFRDGTMRDVALEVLEIARSGLKARARLDSNGHDEAEFLTTLDEIAESGSSPAEIMLEQLDDGWQGSVNQVFREYAY